LTERSIPELETAYEGKGYGDLKVDLAAILVEFVTPFQESVRSYMDDVAELDKVLARGAERAREVASETLTQVYDRVGFLPPAR